MKKALMLILVLFSPLLISYCFAEEVKLSETRETKLSKSEIYSRTKMFIADTWNSANTVIQNDDFEGGDILVKSIQKMGVNTGMGTKSRYTYKFTTSFKFKDNKYRIEIYDIVCTEANQTGFGAEVNVPLIQPFFGDEPIAKTIFMGKGLNKKRAVKMMQDLIFNLKGIEDSYVADMNKVDDF
ncbi:MAG: DUF4468 domain-containing protein [Bacteroidales bacterium]